VSQSATAHHSKESHKTSNARKLEAVDNLTLLRMRTLPQSC